jgi:hypothetical protein
MQDKTWGPLSGEVAGQRVQVDTGADLKWSREWEWEIWQKDTNRSQGKQAQKFSLYATVGNKLRAEFWKDHIDFM